MGREIRRVPPNWEHPTWKAGDEYEGRSVPSSWIGSPKPLYDEDFPSAARQWLDNAIAWDRGSHETILKDPSIKERYPFFWQWEGNPPDLESYRPAWTEEPTAFQVYETVSEGTPDSPVFETLDELENWLVNKRGHSRENAAAFCRTGYVPSMIMSPQIGIRRGIDAASFLEDGDAS